MTLGGTFQNQIRASLRHVVVKKCDAFVVVNEKVGKGLFTEVAAEFFPEVGVGDRGFLGFSVCVQPGFETTDVDVAHGA